MTLHRTEIPSTAPSLKTWILLADWLAGRAPQTELPRRFGPCPHSHQTTIMIMQMHSEKAWDITSYQVELGLFEVTGFCQFQLTRVFCLDIIYLFAWKLQLFFFFFYKNVWAEARKLYWRKYFSQGLNGYRSWERKAPRMLSVSLQWITIAFLDLLVEEISLSQL